MNINYKKILKRTLITISVIIIFIITLLFSLRIPKVQNYIKDQFITYLESKIKTEVELEYIYVNFPTTISLKNLNLKGEDVDTLLAVEQLNVDLDFWKILNKKIKINNIDLEGATTNITLKKDGTFNFDYILNAFTSEEKDKQTNGSKPFLIDLNRIKLERINISYNDLQNGYHLNIFLNSFNTRIKTFDLDKNKYEIGKINLDGLKLNLKQEFVAYLNNKSNNNKTESKPIQLKLGDINLSNFNIGYEDDINKLKADIRFNQLNTFIKTIDLSKNNYSLNDINLNGLNVNFSQGISNIKQEKDVKKSTSTPLSIELNQVNLTNTNINYNDLQSKTFARIKNNKLVTKINKLDLANSYFDIEEIALKQTDIKVDLALETSQQQNNQASTSNYPITVILKQGKLDDFNIIYNNTNAKPIRNGLDYNHINLKPISLDLRNFKMFENQFSGTVKSAALTEKSGLNIQAFTTDFLYANNQAYLKNLYLRTPQTLLQKEIKLDYTSINQLSNQLGKVKIYADIKNSKIGFKDILLLAPDLKNTTPFKQYKNATLYANAKINGTVDNLAIDQFSLNGIDDINLKANGKIKNATNFNLLAYDLNIIDLGISAKTIYTFLPKNTLPNNIRIPSKINLKGQAKGTTNLIDTNFNLLTSLGNVNGVANIDLRKKDLEKYSIKTNLKDVQIGSLISTDQVGKISAKLAIDGIGFDPKKAIVTANGNLISAEINQYSYQNISFDAASNRGDFKLNLNSKDTNALLNLSLAGSYKNELENVKIDGTINELNLQKLNFYNDPLIIAGNIVGDFKNLDINLLNGKLQLTDFAISNTQEIYPIQDIILTCTTTENSNQITLNSQLVDIDLNGKFKPNQLITSLSKTLNQYYQFNTNDYKEEIDDNQYILINATIKNDDLIRKFVPDLTDFQPISLNASYNTTNHELLAKGQIPVIVYNDLSIGNAIFNLDNTNDKLNYNFSINELKNNDYQVNSIFLTGNVAQNKINFELKKNDSQNTIQYLLAGNVEKQEQSTIVQLNPKGLILNYDQWNISPENNIAISDKSFFANHFDLTFKDSKISLQSEDDNNADYLNLTIENFKIETITEIIKKDDLPASGLINGTARINDLTKELTFTTDLTISDLNVFNHPIGNLLAKIENTSPTKLSVDVEIAGIRNNAKVIGEYDIKQTKFDLDLAINHLDMMSIQSFSKKMIQDAEGFLSGNLSIKGSIEQPSILGNVKFNDVGLTIASTGSNFRKLNDDILFTSKGIEFNRFKINDKDDNSITINGAILTQNYRDFDFELTAFGRNFKIVNSKKSSDALTYGVLAVNANLQIKGNLDLPKVSGTLTVTDETDFTFVLPQSSPELQEREGIVEFIDKSQIDLEKTIEVQTLNAQSTIKGLDVNVNIEVNKKAKSTIIIDKANGDFLEVQGEAQLTGGIDPSGKMTLVGVFEIESGAYELSVSLIKRRFDIKQGSTITWTGEPTTAMLNITAIYTVSTAPIDLIQQQLTGLTTSEINQYKQKIPFNTNLILTGELLQPVINFNITLNDSNPSVSTSVIDNTNSKLIQLRTDEAEMNKQVFALILLNRFIGENPFQSQSGVSAETLAKQSVSNILAQQLNNVAADLIKGVDINFGLNTEDDYSTGNKNTRTDLNVSVSKKLLNDRLKIMVGSNFGLEGNARENENMTNIAGDITIDYDLSRNGRYMLRAFRKNEYQVALHGQVIETGIGFIITIDYDEFKEIFKKQRRSKNNRKAQRTESK